MWCCSKQQDLRDEGDLKEEEKVLMWSPSAVGQQHQCVNAYITSQNFLIYFSSKVRPV